ncbi:hypothetical protein HK100_003985 [Physocladia obscura]|uniref:Cytokinin riboside 5'-monophosphate phosphoribohydrolase n=1 Tax=Physocladia obscura TaxID=109957 RepID=A0AAD5SW13_9FUNG|nr:hypothetical protein HK100_003985 [Physocladia obscura]
MAAPNGLGAAVETVHVPDMHTRKAQFERRSDAFVALPGGLGTFEELLECATWAQLGIHAKPIVVLNVAGFFDPLVALLDRAVDEGFLTPNNRHLVVFAADPASAIDAFFSYAPPVTHFAFDWSKPAI